MVEVVTTDLFNRTKTGTFSSFIKEYKLELTQNEKEHEEITKEFNELISEDLEELIKSRSNIESLLMKFNHNKLRFNVIQCNIKFMLSCIIKYDINKCTDE